MKTKIELCLCIDHEKTAADSVYYGMPILIPTENMDYWRIECPNCGRMGIGEYKSPYLAIKDWNKVMRRRSEKLFEEENE